MYFSRIKEVRMSLLSFVFWVAWKLTRISKKELWVSRSKIFVISINENCTTSDFQNWSRSFLSNSYVVHSRRISRCVRMGFLTPRLAAMITFLSKFFIFLLGLLFKVIKSFGPIFFANFWIRCLLSFCSPKVDFSTVTQKFFCNEQWSGFEVPFEKNILMFWWLYTFRLE